MRHRWCCCSQG